MSYIILLLLHDLGTLNLGQTGKSYLDAEHGAMPILSSSEAACSRLDENRPMKSSLSRAG